MSKETFSLKSIPASVVGFLAGIVLSTIAEDVYKNRLLDSAQIPLSLTFICLVALGMITLTVSRLLDMSRKQIMDQLVDSKRVIAETFLGLTGQIAGLDCKIGIKIRYVDQEKGRAHLFRELRKHVEQAEKRIIVVNTFRDEHEIPDSDMETSAERRLYYDSILKRVSERHVLYERIIQVQDEVTFNRMFSSLEYLRHFHMMLDEAEKQGLPVGLIKAPAIRPMTFTLIDDRWLLLQIDQRDSMDSTHMHSILIFEDPQQVVVRYFQDFYQAIRMKTLGAIQRSALPPRPD